MRSWILGPRFPNWLKSHKDFLKIDISNSGISDVIPNWFLNLANHFSYMNLFHNHIYGEVPDMLPIGGFTIIYLGSNKFNGPLPHISSDVTELDLSNNLFSGGSSHFLSHEIGVVPKALTCIHLGGNLLSGKIPDCWMNWPALRVIKLDNNTLSEEIPSSIGSLFSASQQ